MRTLLGPTLLLTLSSIACQSALHRESAPTPVERTGLPALQRWQQLVNALSDSLARAYNAEAIKVTPAGEVISGAAAITRVYRTQPIRVDSIYTLHEFYADREERFSYEIGGFVTPSGEYRHLLVRDNAGHSTRRVLELTAPVRPTSSARAAIDRRRAEWIERCNQNDARALIENLYAPNTVYYNHRPPITGREDLIEAYAYMNNPNYQLHLEPLAFSMVNENLAYEIGQCSGSYGGKYIIAWQRDARGEWYVLLDSNI